MSGRIVFEDTKTNDVQFVDLNLVNVMDCLNAVIKLAPYLKGSWTIREIHGEGKLWDFLREELKKKQGEK